MRFADYRLLDAAQAAALICLPGVTAYFEFPRPLPVPAGERFMSINVAATRRRLGNTERIGWHAPTRAPGSGFADHAVRRGITAGLVSSGGIRAFRRAGIT